MDHDSEVRWSLDALEHESAILLIGWQKPPETRQRLIEDWLMAVEEAVHLVTAGGYTLTKVSPRAD